MAGMRAVWFVLIWLTACVVEPPTRTAPPVVEPATRTAPPVVEGGAPSPLVERVAVLPARFGAVGWFSIDQAPLVSWVQGMPGAPACIAEIKAGLEGYLQASDLAAAQSVIVFRGAVDRAKVEACVRALVEHVGVPVEVTPSGRITVVTSKGRTLTHLGWSDDGTVVWNDERAVVEEVLDRKTSLRADAALASLLARVDPARPAWIVSTLDVTSFLIEVPSHGFFFAGDLAASGAAADAAPLTFVFASPDDAARAAAGFAKAATSARHSASVKRVLAELRPVARGRDVELDIRPLFASPGVLEELTASWQASLGHKGASPAGPE